MIARRRLCSLGAALLVLPAAVRPALAADRMDLLAGAPAGSAPDVQACSFAPFLERHLPRTEIGVRDVVGESGLAAYRALADAPPDGALLGWATSPGLPARLVDHDGGALMDRLVLLGAVQQEPIVLVAAPGDLPDLPHLLESLGAGGSTTLGTPPAGSAAHLAALRLQTMLPRTAAGDASLNIVAFPSEAAARQAAMAGNVVAALLTQGAALPALRDGRLHGCGLAATERSEALPDLPTFREAGIAFVSLLRRGLAAPAGLPPDLRDRLVGAMQAAVQDPEFQDQGRDRGFDGRWLDGAGWTAEVEAERVALDLLWQAAPWLSLDNG